MKDQYQYAGIKSSESPLCTSSALDKPFFEKKDYIFTKLESSIHLD